MMTVEPVFFSKLPKRISSIWNQLLDRSPSPTFQYDFYPIWAWTQYTRKDWHPFLLKVKKENSVKGLFPLMYRNEKRRGLLPYRRIRFLGYNFTDFSTVLSANQDLEKVTIAALEWLFSGEFRWELLILDDLVENNPIVNTLHTWLATHINSYHVVKGKYYYINLEAPWEAIWQQTSKHFVRSNINNAKNRITKAGSTWKITINPYWDTEKLIAKASLIHIKRQQEKNRMSFYAEPDSKAFITKMIEYNKKKGRFRSYWLQCDNNEIAYIFGFEQNRVFYYWNVAFHPEYARFYPSRLLLFKAIQDCHKRKLKEFNLMRGETDYKSKWTQSNRVNYRFIIKNTKTLYGKMIVFLENILK